MWIGPIQEKRGPQGAIRGHSAAGVFGGHRTPPHYSIDKCGSQILKRLDPHLDCLSGRHFYNNGSINRRDVGVCGRLD